MLMGMMHKPDQALFQDSGASLVQHREYTYRAVSALIGLLQWLSSASLQQISAASEYRQTDLRGIRPLRSEVSTTCQIIPLHLAVSV